MNNNKSESKPKTWQLLQDIKNMELEIDAHKQIERVLKSREDRFKTIFNHAPIAYFIIDLNGNFVDGNITSVELTGYKQEDLYGKTFIKVNLIEKKDQKAISKILIRSAKGELTGPDEFTMLKKDGSRLTVEISTSPITINNEKLILGVAHDITARKKAQVKLQESEERFRKLFDSAHDALMTLNPPTWNFTSGNPAISKMFNVKNVEEFLTYSPWDISPDKQPDGRSSVEKAKEMIEIAMSRGSNYFEWTHKRINGKSFPATVLLTKIQLKDETFLQATVRDITKHKKSENILKKSESLLKSILDSTGDGLLVVDAKRRITHKNNEFIKMWKIPSRLINDTDDSKLINFVLSQLSKPSQFVDRVKKLYNSTKTSYDILHFKDGRIFERNSQPLMGNNTIAGRVWSFRDITERLSAEQAGKQAESELRQSEEKFKSLFNNLGDAVYVTKLSGPNRGRILEINNAAVRQTGYKRNELLKMNIVKDIYISGSGESKGKDWEGKLRKGEIVTTIEKKRRKDGVEFWTEVIISSIEFKGEVECLSVNHDITERRQTEATLKQSETEYRTIFQTTGTATLILGKDYTILLANDGFVNLSGFPREQLEGKKLWTEFIVEEDIERMKAQHELQRQDEEQSLQNYEFRFKGKSGKIKDIYLSVNMISGTEYSIASLLDITERKQAEREIRQKAKELEKQFKISEEQRIATLAALSDLNETTKELKFEINQRKKSEIALKENEEKYRTLTENLPIGIYRNTPGGKGKFIEVNNALVDMFGFKDRKAMLKVSVSSLYVSSGMRKKFSDKLNSEGFVRNEELRLLRQDGSTFIGSSSARAVKDETGKIIHYDGYIEDVTERWELRNQLLESEEKFRSIVDNSPDIILRIDLHGVITYINYEYSNHKPEDIIGKTLYEFMPAGFQEIAQSIIKKVFKDGLSLSFENLSISGDEAILWYRNNVAPLIQNGKVIAATIIATDISEQKHMDIMKNEFIGSVSHELRTPLTIIRESLSILSDGLFGELNKDQLDLVNPCLEDVDRLARIINNLLDISRIEGQKITLEREMVDIVKLAQSVKLSFGNKAATKNIELVITSTHESINLYIDRDRIIQVFMNLIGNAMKFTEKGKIEIFITEKANEVECCIADTGRGIEQKDIGTLFDRFHQVGKVMRAGEKGSGLGLSISKGIINLHNGRIWVESEINKGSKFYFTLPQYSTDKIIINNIENEIEKAADSHVKLSLLLIKLNNYSKIESKFSIDKANKVNRLILQIIQSTLAPGEFSFMKGKDEVMLFSDITKQNIIILFSKLGDLLKKSVSKIDKELTVDLSYGYSLYPDNGNDAKALIKYAEASLNKKQDKAIG